MTLDEFKAWFEGFTENVDGQPTKKQWERIKARVGEIDGQVTPYPVYIERYYKPWWQPVWSTGGIQYSNAAAEQNTVAGTGRFVTAGRMEAAATG